MLAPSPRTKPSLDAEKGRDAVSGESFLDFAVEVVGVEVASAANAAVFGNNHFVETVFVGQGLFDAAVVLVAAEVPFADDAGGVAVLFEGFCDCDVVE